MNPTMNHRTSLHAIAALMAALAMAACSDDDSPAAAAPPVAAPPVAAPPVAAPPAAPVSTTVTGAVVKGPVNGAQICGYTVVANARGTALGSCTTSDAMGNYTLTLPAGSGPLWLEASGGSYTDEATSAATTLPAGAVLSSLVTANGAAVTTMLTPLTTLALNAARAAAGSNGTLDATAFASAAAQLLATFNLPSTLDLQTVLPAFGGAANAYGQALTVVSQMVANGLPLSQILATAQPAALQAAYVAAATPPAASGAPLVISAATPATWNGTLSVAAAQFEHGSGSETGGGPFDAGQPYCRVAAYGLLNSGDGIVYFLQIPFRKSDKAVGLVQFGLDASLATQAREPGPLAGMSIDTVQRRITFVNTVIGTNSSKTLTLNGTLDYPTNVDPLNRAACG